jgi:hypothetical protein
MLMKKLVIFTLVVFLVLISSKSYGQGEPNSIRFGFKMGMTSSTFARDFQPVFDPRIAPQIGLSIDYQVIDILSVSLDAMYMEHGISNHQIRSNPFVEENLAIYGIDAPLVINLYPLGMGTRAIPKFFAGNSFGFNLYERAVNYTKIGEVSGTPFFAKSLQKGSSDYKLLDFGAIFGTGLLIPSERGLFSIDCSYRIGYFDISNHVGTITTNTASISVAYWF